MYNTGVNLWSCFQILDYLRRVGSELRWCEVLATHFASIFLAICTGSPTGLDGSFSSLFHSPRQTRKYGKRHINSDCRGAYRQSVSDT